MREHNVGRLTASELERARRELAASLALARPDSPIRTPILSHMTAIDTELADRNLRTDGSPATCSTIQHTASGP
jgi:hypothetical protein